MVKTSQSCNKIQYRNKSITALKMILDLLMTLSLLFLMGYQFWGDTIHEWVGMGIFVLFILHHFLNKNWFSHLFKGRYSAFRILTTAVDVLAIICMVLQMYSAIIISRHVFTFLNIHVGTAFARKLHILGAFWGFILLAFHIGLHWAMMIGLFKRMLHITKPSKVRSAVSVLAFLVIGCYGLYQFFSHGLLDNMLLRYEFIFMDFSASKIMFYLDYLAILIFIAGLGHYIAKVCKKIAYK